MDSLLGAAHEIRGAELNGPAARPIMSTRLFPSPNRNSQTTNEKTRCASSLYHRPLPAIIIEIGSLAGKLSSRARSSRRSSSARQLDPAESCVSRGCHEPSILADLGLANSLISSSCLSLITPRHLTTTPDRMIRQTGRSGARAWVHGGCVHAGSRLYLAPIQFSKVRLCRAVNLRQVHGPTGP
jgi:hypothetical protein